MSLHTYCDTDDGEEGDGVCQQLFLLNVLMFTLRGVLGVGSISCVELMLARLIINLLLKKIMDLDNLDKT
jgi:hypothetical protein